LVLWDSNDKPRVAIEVKKDAWNYYEDLIRLNRLLKRGLEFSVFASCWFEEVKDNNFKEAEDKLEEEIEFLRKYILDDNGKLGVNPSIELVHSNIDHLTIQGERSEDNEELVWRPVIFKIYSKENHE
jgi:hypothetical protein